MPALREVRMSMGLIFVLVGTIVMPVIALFFICLPLRGVEYGGGCDRLLCNPSYHEHMLRHADSSRS